MKWLKFVLIFLIFLTLGTYIATLFSPNTHASECSETLAQSDSFCWNFISDIKNAPYWMQNVDSIVEKPFQSKGDTTDYIVYVHDASGNHSQFNLSWWVASSVHQLKIETSLPDKVDMYSTWNIETKGTDSCVISNRLEVRVHGWLNRLLMTNIEGALLDREIQEFKGIKLYLVKD